MLVPFNYIEEATCNLRYIVSDNFNVMSQYAVSTKDVLNLCGGVPSGSIRRLQVDISSSYPGSLNVQVTGDVYELSRTIHLDAGYIVNNFMDVNWQQQGIGTRLLLNQVKAARNMNFVKLTTVAQFCNGDGQQLHGYYCWGRLGYTMTHTDQIDFLNWAQRNKRVEKTLFSLLTSESGKKLWKANGFEWSGEFLLSENSINMIQLHQYTLEKGLAYTF